MHCPCPKCSTERETLEARCHQCGWTPPPLQTVNKTWDPSNLPMENSSKSLPPYRMEVEGQGLTIEWLMRDIGHSIFVGVWWIGWTAAVVFMTQTLSTGTPPSAVFLLVSSYIPVVLVPLIWLVQRSPERIEFDATTYRHYYPSHRWFLPRRWSVAEITTIEFTVDEDGDTSLMIKKGRTGDLIWTPPKQLQRIFFDAIQKHLNSIGSKVEFVDLVRRGQ